MAGRDRMQDLPEDPFVRNTGGGRPAGEPVVLSGLWGESERDGYRRLYLTTSLDYFVEFPLAQVLAVDDIPPATPPFEGLDATRVTLSPGAVVDWVNRRRASADDAFRLDVRSRFLAAADRKVQPQFTETQNAECPTHTWEARCPTITVEFSDRCGTGFGTDTGGGGTFGPPPTVRGPSCQTCGGADTCVTCTEWTCGTCGEATCATCEGPRCAPLPDTNGTCGEETCFCGTASCWGCTSTCRGCPPVSDVSCNVSCGGSCDASCLDQCPTNFATCPATCDTCGHTCNGTCARCVTDVGPFCFLPG